MKRQPGSTAERTLSFGIIAGITGALLLGFGAGCGSDSSTVPDSPPDPTPYELQIPVGFPRLQIPEDNPTTVEGVALGRRLFYDPILSRDETISCSSCHQQDFAFSDGGAAVSTGIDGQVGTRNAPALVNIAWLPTAFWDGRAASLEDQAREPVHNPIEMDLSWEEAVTRLEDHDEYPALFRAAFGPGPITEDNVVKAIAQFERTLISGNSKYDRVERGEESYTESERRGKETLFLTERGDCFHCHGNVLFTTSLFHDIGLDLQPVDGGRGGVTGVSIDDGKFKTPTLRNIEFTGPYMHDGRYKTLEEAVRHYEEDIQRSPNLDPLMLTRLERPDSMVLTDQDVADIVAFLKTLSDPSFLTNPEFSDPKP